MIELGGGGEAASRGSSQCTQETDKHIRCGCGSVLRTRRNGLTALISEGNAYALLTVPSSSTFRDRLSTRPLLEREAGQLLEHCKTYTMPWQTCLVCPRYPFPSLLLLDPPALWQPSPPVNRTAISHATLIQYP